MKAKLPILKIVAYSCLLIVLLAIGGFIMVKSGVISAAQLLQAGSGEVAIVNAADSDVVVTLTQLDVGREETKRQHSYTLHTFSIGSFGGVIPGRYAVTFDIVHGIPKDMNCTLQIGHGDEYQFTLVPEGITITKVGFEPVAKAELLVHSSSLCQVQ